ncbi:MAG: N-acetylmuramic acid 6-phosphate etherase [Actinomycetota bacterium]
MIHEGSSGDGHGSSESKEDDVRLEVDGLVTEQHRPELAEIDRMPTRALLRVMNEEDERIPVAIAAVLDDICAIVEMVAEHLGQGGRLVYVGAGTSGRLGVIDAAECVPTFNVPPDEVLGVMAGGDRAFARSVEGVEDDVQAGASDVAALEIQAPDVVVGITASGRTPYVVGALTHARDRGAATAAVSCNHGSQVSGIADRSVEVVVGPEIVSGSTRLKAGTAQKMVLSMISTATMVRLGKTYGNLMVDVHATNDKLRRRAQRIVEIATGRDEDESARALSTAGGDAKTAILVLLTGESVEGARRLLERHGGVIRSALEGSSAEDAE